ncbi:MAG TPA: acyltransferase family protein [Azospirillum sp.]
MHIGKFIGQISPVMHHGYRRDIDGLRAIAVLSVVAFHASPLNLRGGFVGVDIFFVISGFLISSIIMNGLLEGRFSFAEFYARRIKRIFPALITVIVGVYALGYFVFLPDDYRNFGKHIISGAAFVSNITLWTEAGYFDRAAETKPLLHLWSLGVEEQFYILFPIIFYVFHRMKINLIWPIALGLAASFLINIGTVHSSPAAAFFSPASRFWELLVGALLAYLTVHRAEVLPQRPMMRNVLSSAGMALLLAALYLTDKSKAFPGWWALMPTVGAALLIAAGPQAWANRWILANPLAVWIGLISYPLYLWHWPLLSLASIDAIGEAPSRLARFGAVGVSVLLAWLTYRFIEIPIRFTPRRSTWKVAALCATMASVGAVGFVTYRSDGLSFRYPALIADLITGNFNRWPKIPFTEKCFLAPDEGDSRFGACTEPGERPLMYVWGDSHSGMLANGLMAYRQQHGIDFRVAVYTASSCPPLLDYDQNGRPLCRSVNDANFRRIRELRPEVLVMNAFWMPDNLTPLGDTLERLKAAGVKRIIVVGSPPAWKDDLPKVLFAHYRQGGGKQMPPARMMFGLHEDRLGFDQLVRSVAEQHGVTFVSAMDMLCTQEGCLTRYADKASALTGFDTVHLSLPAAERLAERLIERVGSK